MTLELITGVGLAILLIVAAVLCVALIVAVVKLLPPLLQTARNLEKISSDFAAVSGGHSARHCQNRAERRCCDRERCRSIRKYGGRNRGFR